VTKSKRGWKRWPEAANEAAGLRRTILGASEAGFPAYRRVGHHKTASILAQQILP